MEPVTPVDLDRLAPGPRARLAFEVFGTYLQVRWVMRDPDAGQAVRRLRRRLGSPPEAVQDEDAMVLAAWRLSKAVIKVLEPLPSDSRCLFRSLTLLCILQRRGIVPRLVIAVRSDPFGAHAWLEVCGRAVLPAAEPGYERLLEL
jgi:hypothetical protein